MSGGTHLLVRPRGGSMQVYDLRRADGERNWVGGAEVTLGLPAASVFDAHPLAVTWTPAPPTMAATKAIFTFTSGVPRLQMRSVWTLDSSIGPAGNTLTVTNAATKAVDLVTPETLALGLSWPTARRLEALWVEKGAGVPTAEGVHRTEVTPGTALDVLSTPYSQDLPRDAVPLLFVRDPASGEGWYVGVESSARVRIRVDATDAGVKVRAGLDAGPDGRDTIRLAPGEVFHAPSVFVGCFKGDYDDAANQLRREVARYLRAPTGEPNYPLLVNNSWGSGMAVDEKLAKAMIDDAAALGIEMYHIDAGWFRGVGDWHPNPDKFPNGLAPVADYVHGKGMKFGLWVGWTQGGIDMDDAHKILSVVDPTMRGWFTHDYEPNWKPSDFTGADVCLGDPRAADWCLAELRRIVREYKLDLLEHDQRMIVQQCDRKDHLHGSGSGDVSYAAAQGYERVYDTLRSENPSLLFEDCVNGGRMVDYGVTQRVHYISITDTYDPLSNRRAFYDASYALPPAMCECYVENRTGNTPESFLYMLRSGMMGWCTIMCDTTKWSPEQHAAARKEFAFYKKSLRPLINAADLYHVSERPDGVRWDGIQYVDPKAGRGALFAFRGTTAEASHTFKLRGLDAGRRYRLTASQGEIPAAEKTGAELMGDGLTITLPQPQSSVILTLEAAG